MNGSSPYVHVEDQSVGGSSSKFRRIVLSILNVFALILSITLFACGILSLIASHTYPFDEKISYDITRGVKYYRHTAIFSIRVLSAYLLFFALLFIFVELKSTIILTAVAGMISPLGRGVVYLITGLLTFGLAGNFGLLYGPLWMLCGILHIIVGFRNCANFYDEGTVDNGSAVITREKVDQGTYDSSAIASTNFCRSCGATLRPGDAYCPDCSAAV